MDNTQEINQEINRPTHYGSKIGRDVIDIAEEFGFIDNAYVFNIFKYLIRAGRKRNNSVLQDALKARVYLDRYIDSIKKNVSIEQNDSSNSKKKILNGNECQTIVDEHKFDSCLRNMPSDSVDAVGCCQNKIEGSIIKRATELIDETNKALDNGATRRDVMKNILGMSDSEINEIIGLEKKTNDSSSTKKRMGRYFSRSNI